MRNSDESECSDFFTNDDDNNANDDIYLRNAALMKNNGLAFVLLDPSLWVSHRKPKSLIMNLLRHVYHRQPPTQWTCCLGPEQIFMFFGVSHCKVNGKVVFALRPLVATDKQISTASEALESLTALLVHASRVSRWFTLSVWVVFLQTGRVFLLFAVLPIVAAWSILFSVL